MRRVLPATRTEPKTSRVKEDLRRRCIVRAAAQREALIARARGGAAPLGTSALAQDIIKVELMALSAPPGASSPSCSAWSEADEVRLHATLGREAYLELMSATEESLLRELEGAGWSGGSGGDGGGSSAADDEATVEAYEAYLREEEVQALAAADGPAAGSLEAVDSVPCPLCVRAPLQLGAGGCVECSLAPTGGCALRIDTHGRAAPLQLLREQMCVLLEEHRARCPAQASCRLPLSPAEAQLGQLLFGCGACGLCVGVV